MTMQKNKQYDFQDRDWCQESKCFDHLTEGYDLTQYINRARQYLFPEVGEGEE